MRRVMRSGSVPSRRNASVAGEVVSERMAMTRCAGSTFALRRSFAYSRAPLRARCARPEYPSTFMIGAHVSLVRKRAHRHRHDVILSIAPNEHLNALSYTGVAGEPREVFVALNGVLPEAQDNVSTPNSSLRRWALLHHIANECTKRASSFAVVWHRSQLHADPRSRYATRITKVF